MKWTLRICGVCMGAATGIPGAGHGPERGSGHRADGFSRADFPAQSRTSAPLPSGMTRVFDGKTLAGWKQIPRISGS